MNERIVVVCSGSADPGRAVTALAAAHRADIVALALELGGGDVARACDAARDGGAVRCHVVDARDRFVRECVLPSLKAHVRGAGAADLALVVMARTLVEIARLEHATAVAHTSVDADARRLETLVRELDSGLTVLAVPGDGPAPPVGVAVNLWGRVGAGPVSHASACASEGRPRSGVAGAAPGQGATVEIRFEAGVPAAVNGVDMPPVELIDSLSTIAGAHGVGCGEGPGPESLDGCEAPAAVALHCAHEALEALALPADLRRFKALVSTEYGEMIARGQWFTPLREALDAFVESAQRRVTGVVHLWLARGQCHVVRCEVGAALYDRERTDKAPAGAHAGIT